MIFSLLLIFHGDVAAVAKVTYFGFYCRQDDVYPHRSRECILPAKGHPSPHPNGQHILKINYQVKAPDNIVLIES